MQQCRLVEELEPREITSEILWNATVSVGGGAGTKGNNVRDLVECNSVGWWRSRDGSVVWDDDDVLYGWALGQDSEESRNQFLADYYSVGVCLRNAVLNTLLP